MRKKELRIWLAVAAAVCALGMNVYAEDEEAGEEELMTEFEEWEEETLDIPELEEIGEKPEYRALDYVTLGDYNGLSVTIEDYGVSDEMVEDAFWDAVEGGIEEYELYEVDKESAVEEGDTVNIDYDGTVNGEAVEGLSTEGAGEDITVGDGMFIEGFEEQLIGAKPGETLEVMITFPEDYGLEELDGQDAVFVVTVNYIKRIPELSDDLISKITDGEVKTVDDYREYQRSELEDYNREDQETQINDEIMNQLYNICEVNEYPQDLVDYSTKSVKNYYIEMAQTFGMSFEELMGYYGEEDGSFEEIVYDDVINELQQEMILNAVAEKEDLILTDAEYDEGLKKYAEMYGLESPEEFESYYDHDTIAQSLQMTKVLDFIRESAVVDIVEVEEETDLYFDEDMFEMMTEDFEDMSEIGFYDMDEEFDTDFVFDEDDFEFEFETEE